MPLCCYLCHCQWIACFWSWTILHARTLYIYQTLLFECLGGVVCLVEKRRLFQPLWSLRVDGTPLVVSLVSKVRLFFLFFSEHEMGPTLGSVPVPTPAAYGGY